MNHLSWIFILSAALASATAPALAQKATEIYIPIGQSPGLSGKHTLLGKIQATNPSDQSMTVIDSSGRVVTVRPDANTRVWLDYSKTKQRNREGGYNDYRKDQVVEIRYLGNDRQAGKVEWVKVQMAP